MNVWTYEGIRNGPKPLQRLGSRLKLIYDKSIINHEENAKDMEQV